MPLIIGIFTPGCTSAFSGGLLTQPLTVTLAGADRVITATSTGTISGTSNGFTVNPGAAAQLVITQQPDLNPIASNSIPFVPQPILELRDAFDNVRTADTANVVADVHSGGGGGDLKGTKTLPLVSGVVTYTDLSLSKANVYVLIFTRGTFTVTSESINVQAAGFSQMQLLVPGETADPGSATGKTGTPITQTAGVPFTVTVNAVDANWNLVPTAPTDSIGITATDALAILPADANLASGTRIFTVTLKTAGTATLTARNITNPSISPDTSPAIPVISAFALTKTATPNPVNAGSSITYTVRITNTGASPATTVKLTDTLPVTVTGVTYFTTGGLSCSGVTSIVCTVNTLTVNASAILTVTGTVSATAISGSQIVNTAQVSAIGMTSAESVSVTTTVQRSVALTITKTAFSGTVLAGQPITYTVRITNSGPSNASNLVVTDTLPPSVTDPISSTGGVMSCSGSSTITCTLGSLAASSSVTLTITGTVSASAPHGLLITNTTDVTAAEVSAAQTALAATVVNTLADLQITKSEDYTNTPVVGSIVTYTLSITNSGPSYATAVYITDTLPVSVAFGSVIAMTPSNFFGTPVNTMNTVSWMTDMLATGSGSIVFTGTISDTGNLINSVVITSTTADNETTNNSNATGGFTASGSTIALAVADVWLRAESTATTVALDAPTEFVFRAGNRGSIAVDRAIVSIQSTADLVGRLLAEPDALCPRTESGIICRLPLLLPGDEIEIGVLIPVDQSGSFASVWTIESGLFDPNPDDNRVEQRWVVEGGEWRFFLPFLQSNLDAERNRTEEHEIYLPSVGSP